MPKPWKNSDEYNNKFQNIQYPIYCLKKLPEIVVTYDKVTTASGKLIKSTRYNRKSYLESLILMTAAKENRITFDITARNTSELIRSHVKWGIDNTGTIFDFSVRQKFPFRTSKIDKITHNLVWISDISYPLHMYADLETIKYDLYLGFVHLVKVNLTWELYNFSLSLPDKIKSWVYL